MFCKQIVPEPFLLSVEKSLEFIVENISQQKDEGIPENIAGCAAECFRCLRQACALNKEVQENLSTHPNILAQTKAIIEKSISFDPHSDKDNVLKCATQFLGNACVSNAANQKVAWKTFLQLFRSLLLHPDSKVCDYTCMLVHTCLSQMAKNDQTLLTNAAVQDIVLACIQAAAQRDVEWGLYVLEDMLKNDLFLSKLYSRMGQKERLLLLEVILAEMNELPTCADANTKNQEVTTESENENQQKMDPQGDKSDGEGGLSPSSENDREATTSLAVSTGNLQFIAEEVKRECNLLLEIDKSEATGQEVLETQMLEALVITKELETLGIAAQHKAIYPGIQEDSDLLCCAVNLLRSITEMGKCGHSVFKREEKASAEDSVDPHHPVYGLKKDLIRLIANMAYKHRGNQDTVRSLDGISLLLDLTMIDTRNPFITQWVVLAIRNLVEGNRENRDVLSGMSLQGMAGHMAQLREVGVHTELKGGKIVVKPVERNK
ncbi:ataxin-10-like [Plakobranchus ocellatus]|uniref:Ataxin-10 n=1 Tax=Plakobranchus ocellatus TaxID=259542 RepID=A0AAV4ADV3_9GAST|nr:ataxin-10-like [Plakobranchus ocellatus]